MISVPTNRFTELEGTQSEMMPRAIAELLEKQAAPRIWARQVAFERGLLGKSEQPIKITKLQKGFLETEIFGRQLDLGVKKGSRRFTDPEITAFGTYFSQGGGEVGMQALIQSPKKILLSMKESSQHWKMKDASGNWVERPWATKVKGEDIFTLKTEEVVKTRWNQATGESYKVVETKLAGRSDEGLS